MQSTVEPVFITSFGELELCNALQLQVFRNTVGPRDVRPVTDLIEEDIRRGILSLQPMSPATFEIGKRLSLKHTAKLGTRTLDIMHVAAALAVGATEFLSFDRNQRKLATAVGMTLVPATI
jgi:predicted nucleic acid-binding protein